MTRETEGALREAFAVPLPHLDERQRRLALGSAARVLGVRRVVRVAESTPCTR
ncbi:hypothetical protein [Kitasatospora sp. Root107]|uniref:hypothetical protein n=1 Tax=Kitasatospora sp. Root107 TaxID=1736424 RepID=UPI000A56A4A8